MMQLARPSAPATQLISYWNESRLDADQAKSASVRPAPGIVPWRTAVEDVLKVGYGLQSQSRFVAGAWERVRWRTSPSAGALYPFEVIACVVGEGTYLWDIEKGRLVPSSLASLGREDLASAGLTTAPGHHLDALLVLVARPWLSMKKYHLRGYGYCHLDVGHVAANLATYTAALGLSPTLHLRFSRRFLAERLRLDGLCREPLAVLSFASSRPGLATGPEAETGVKPAGLERPDANEAESWETLQGVLSFDSALEPPSPPAGAPLVVEPEADSATLVPLPEGRCQPSNAKEWRSAILARRSAKGFRREPLNAAQVGELLGALRADSLPEDCLADGALGLGVRLVARNVEGLAGVYAYDPTSHGLRRVASQSEDPRPACMQQELAGNAAALVIFHAPVFRLLDRFGYSAFTELHFHAAQLGQRLHLAAARLDNVGITCIGGFDGLRCADLARLDPDGETVYVVLLGVPDEAAFKHDRLGIAFSHGHTTTLDQR
ncbi:MAG: nitroreductase family protein [Acidobacteriota bacterium]